MQQQKTNRTSSFIGKLESILADDNLKEYISWEKNGTAFTVHNVKAFENSILPKYFRHARFSSFVRQLNMYGFSKVRTTPIDVWQFWNPRFCRDTPTPKRMQRRPPRRDSFKICSISTATSFTSLDLTAECDPATTSSDNIWSTLSFDIEDIEPISDLINRLVQEVRKGEYLLDSDVQERVKELLQCPTFQPISKKFLPFIMECLGLAEKLEQVPRWSSHHSLQLQLDIPDMIESSHL